MKNKKLFQNIVLISLAVAVFIALVAPAIFSQTLQAPKQEKLLNGLKVLMWSDAKADKVTIKIRIHAGAAFDPQGREGVMQLLADNIFPNQASREFFAEDLGGGLEVVTNYDYIQVNASSKPENFLTMLETLSAAVANPSIDKDTTVNLRNALITKVAALEADPSYVADRAVAKRLFGTFPYGRSQYGTTDSIKKIDFADLIDAKGRFLTADNATITISGNFDRTLGFKAIRRYFGGWLKADKKVPSTFRQPDSPIATVLTIASPRADSYAVRYAIRGVARNDKDLYASHLFTNIIETRLKSRVPAGDIFVRNETHTLPGMVIVGFGGEGNGADRAEVDAIILRSLHEPITDTEFQAAKRTLEAEWSAKDVQSVWLDSDTYNLRPEAYKVVNAVTLDDVRSYAGKFLKLPVAATFVHTPAYTN
ncbi:MAG: pitrilysin family protein [Pyrinomonadaceae bacterium]